jgi:hypothetical protein
VATKCVKAWMILHCSYPAARGYERAVGPEKRWPGCELGVDVKIEDTPGGEL